MTTGKAVTGPAPSLTALTASDTHHAVNAPAFDPALKVISVTPSIGRAPRIKALDPRGRQTMMNNVSDFAGSWFENTPKTIRF